MSDRKYQIEAVVECESEQVKLLLDLLFANGVETSRGATDDAPCRRYESNNKGGGGKPPPPINRAAVR
jgi:hypothetical protein